MENNELIKQCTEKAQTWLTAAYDAETQAEVKAMLENPDNAGKKDISVVVGHDCRNNSRKFAEISADIFTANGIKVYLFEDMRPTPEMSFAIRHLGCQSGINITASHNPKEYNGYKAYWEDGAQVLAPHDKGIIDQDYQRKRNQVPGQQRTDSDCRQGN